MKNVLKLTNFILLSSLFLFVSIFSTSLFALSSDWVTNDKSKGLRAQLEGGWQSPGAC